MAASGKFWLLKAEPDTRIVKGKDVKFSVDDFESVKTSPWEGVRNYEARNLMKEMEVGEKALFYHSNCKNPGIAAFAEVSKKAYPDYTAWDSSHPYYDPKSNEDAPKWFMVELTFVSRARHFVPLSLLRHVADSAALPTEIEYIGESGAKAIRGMDLVTRGRLSVQRIDKKAWDVVVMLAEKGGWDDMDLKPKKGRTAAGSSKKGAAKVKDKPVGRRQGKRNAKKVEESEEVDEDDDSAMETLATTSTATGRKRKAKELDEDFAPPRRPVR